MGTSNNTRGKITSPKKKKLAKTQANINKDEEKEKRRRKKEDKKIVFHSNSIVALNHFLVDMYTNCTHEQCRRFQLSKNAIPHF